ncbi:hypothetical protein Zmor_013750 [Zophobas morio]|uniref:RING-type E3 ubiquitin transferase n=1 Tax=Zophobas morio TaxID=2755281 RepID=A0AA38IDG5_9CUCU|nr:hypothetical protein Zmor_013750 [Zophobas morio]
MLAPPEALPLLKCSACTKHLSHFPIYVSRNSDLPTSRALCGRCSQNLTDNETYVRDTLYEAVAQFLKFPCMYHSEGCIESLIPADVPNHEQICPYRIISCPQACIWQGTVHEFGTHIEEIHPNILLREGEFEMYIVNSYETHNFLMLEDEIFNLKRKFDATEKTLTCSVFCYKILDTVTKYYYEITVFNGNKSLSVKFPPRRTENFQEGNTIVIDVEDVRRQLDDPSIIIGSIRIFTINEQKEERPAPLTPRTELELKFLDRLTCLVCFEYMFPPIFQCGGGHSICSNCKNRISECPLCKQEIRDTHNFPLEEMAQLLHYRCKFEDFGCNFRAKPEEMKQHQRFCLFGPHQCPLKDYEDCSWAHAAKEIYPHIVSNHYENLLEVDYVVVFMGDKYFTQEEDLCYIKKFSDALFKLHYRFSKNGFYWAMQLIGPPDEARKYRFEIDVLDNTNSNQKIFLRNFCAPLTDKDETFNEDSPHVFLKLEQIQPLLTDQLNYFIRIIK